MDFFYGRRIFSWMDFLSLPLAMTMWTVFRNTDDAARNKAIAIPFQLCWLIFCWRGPYACMSQANIGEYNDLIWAPIHYLRQYWCILQWRHNEHDGVSNHQPLDFLLNRLFRRWSKKTSKFRVIGLCAWISPVTGEFPTQMASNTENVSVWWRHHENGWNHIESGSPETMSHSYVSFK